MLAPNVSYELTKISQKRQVPRDNVETEKNPAYVAHACVNWMYIWHMSNDNGIV